MKVFGVQVCFSKEIRCKKCRRLLMKGEIKAIEIKCPKCGYIQTIEGGSSIANSYSYPATSFDVKPIGSQDADSVKDRK